LNSVISLLANKILFMRRYNYSSRLMVLVSSFCLNSIQNGIVKRETHFTSQCPANEIMSKIEEVAKPLWLSVHKAKYKVIIYLRTLITCISLHFYSPRTISHVIDYCKRGTVIHWISLKTFFIIIIRDKIIDR